MCVCTRENTCVHMYAFYANESQSSFSFNLKALYFGKSKSELHPRGSCSSGVTAIRNDQVLIAIRNWKVRGFSTPICCQPFSDSSFLFLGYNRQGKAHLLTLHPLCTLLPWGMCRGSNIQGTGVPLPLPADPKLNAVRTCALQLGEPQGQGLACPKAPRARTSAGRVLLGAVPSTPPLPLRGRLPERCAREGPGRQCSLLTHELFKVRGPDAFPLLFGAGARLSLGSGASALLALSRPLFPF